MFPGVGSKISFNCSIKAAYLEKTHYREKCSTKPENMLFLNVVQLLNPIKFIHMFYIISITLDCGVCTCKSHYNNKSTNLYLIKKRIKYKNCLRFSTKKHLKMRRFWSSSDNSTFGFIKTVI